MMMKWSVLVACTGVVGAASASAVAQTVVYDTLSITDDGLYNRAFGNCIGWPPDATMPYDLQLADDFELAGRMTLTRVVADYTSTAPAQAPEAVWVQFFADLGGTPSNEMAADFIARGADVTVIDLGELTVPPPYNHGVRLSVDITNAGISLEPGTWWVSIQPVQLEVPGWYWILRRLNHEIGFDNHGRNGGTHHMGKYGGHAGVLNDAYNDWAALGQIGFLPGSVPMRIEASEACRADFNGDGQVSSQDFFDFLTAFFGNDPSADVNADSLVNSQDFFDFLAVFFAGC